MSVPLIIDNIAIPDSMKDATTYYPSYVHFGGKKHYQEYIQLVERHIDPSKEALPIFINQYLGTFISMCEWSNKYWKDFK